MSEIDWDRIREAKHDAPHWLLLREVDANSYTVVDRYMTEVAARDDFEKQSLVQPLSCFMLVHDRSPLMIGRSINLEWPDDPHGSNDE